MKHDTVETRFNNVINAWGNGKYQADYNFFHQICANARELVIREIRASCVDDIDWAVIWVEWHPSVFDMLHAVIRRGISAKAFAEYTHGADNEEIYTIIYNALISDLSNHIEDNEESLAI